MTGLRPGEKLFEELFVEGEAYRRTAHAKILQARNAQGLIPPRFEAALADLLAAARRSDEHCVRALLQEIIPQYAASIKVNGQQQDAQPAPLSRRLPSTPYSPGSQWSLQGAGFSLE